MKNKQSLILLILFLFIQVNCKKELSGSFKITFLDQMTGAAIPNAVVYVNKEGQNNYPVTIVTTNTDNNGVCQIPRSSLPSSGHVWALILSDYADSTSIGYQYLSNAINLTYPYSNDVICYDPPSGLITFVTFGNFWNNKSYDTLLISSTFGLDTLIRKIDSVSKRNYEGKPGSVHQFNFKSLKNGIQQTVNSEDLQLYCLPNNTPFYYNGIFYSCCYFLKF